MLVSTRWSSHAPISPLVLCWASTGKRHGAKPTSCSSASNARGTVFYRFYRRMSTCLADTSVWTGTQWLHGYNAGAVYVYNGMVPPSQLVRFRTPGVYYWAAFYTGDASNQAPASNCGDEVLWVKPCPKEHQQDGHVTAAAAATAARLRSNG
jgi:hypothetical protein